MLKKTKLYAGITLFVQSFSFLAMFIMLFKKKKGLANAFLAIAAVGGAVGAALLYLDSKDELKRRKIVAARDACCSDYPDDITDDFEDTYDDGEETAPVMF